MDWQQINNGRQEAGDYAIQRIAHYYYELTHTTDGAIRKYRTPEGARRAAMRHKKGDRQYKRRKTTEALLKATLDFQTPQCEITQEAPE